MYPFDISTKRKQKLHTTNTNQPEFLLLSSEPPLHDYVPGLHLSIPYRSRVLAKRRVRRTIQRLKNSIVE